MTNKNGLVRRARDDKLETSCPAWRKRSWPRGSAKIRRTGGWVVHRLTVGDNELTILSDGTYELDGGAMFGVVPKVLWEKRIHADARNMLSMGTNSLLVRDGKRTVLIETGIGSKLNEKSQSFYKNQAQLMKNLEEAGVAPDEIDIVINTHLHFDHCGWNTHYRDGKV